MAALLLNSCAARSIITYLTPDGSTLYFIVPSKLNNDNAEVEMDFTYNTSGQLKDYVTCNFHLRSEEMKFSEIVSAYFTAGGKKLYLTELKIFYRERNSGLIRYGSRIAFDDFKILIRDKKPVFTIATNGSPQIFDNIKPSSDFRKRMETAEKEFIY